MHIIVKIVNRQVTFSLIEAFSAFAENCQFGENSEEPATVGGETQKGVHPVLSSGPETLRRMAAIQAGA